MISDGLKIIVPSDFILITDVEGNSVKDQVDIFLLFLMIFLNFMLWSLVERHFKVKSSF